MSFVSHWRRQRRLVTSLMYSTYTALLPCTGYMQCYMQCQWKFITLKSRDVTAAINYIYVLERYVEPSRLGAEWTLSRALLMKLLREIWLQISQSCVDLKLTFNFIVHLYILYISFEFYPDIVTLYNKIWMESKVL